MRLRAPPLGNCRDTSDGDNKRDPSDGWVKEMGGRGHDGGGMTGASMNPGPYLYTVYAWCVSVEKFQGTC